MITLEDLQAAIAECQGARNPNANTCIKLAAYLTIQQHLYGERPDISSVPYAGYSETPGAEFCTISAISESEFSAAIDGKSQADVLLVLDELMQALSVLEPRLYAATIRKLSEE